jgi:hypothetical protein
MVAVNVLCGVWKGKRRRRREKKKVQLEEITGPVYSTEAHSQSRTLPTHHRATSQTPVAGQFSYVDPSITPKPR